MLRLVNELHLKTESLELDSTQMFKCWFSVFANHFAIINSLKFNDAYKEHWKASNHQNWYVKHPLWLVHLLNGQKKKMVIETGFLNRLQRFHLKLEKRLSNLAIWEWIKFEMTFFIGSSHNLGNRPNIRIGMCIKKWCHQPNLVHLAFVCCICYNSLNRFHFNLSHEQLEGVKWILAWMLSFLLSAFNFVSSSLNWKRTMKCWAFDEEHMVFLWRALEVHFSQWIAGLYFNGKLSVVILWASLFSFVDSIVN